MTPRKRRLVQSALVGIGVGAAVLVVSALGAFDGVRTRALDLLFVTRAAEAARASVIVGIDARSYRELLPAHGTMNTWPRTLYAGAIDRLREAGARVIVLDIFFDAARPDDAALVAAIRRAGNVVTPAEAQGPGPLHPAPGVAQAFEAVVRPTPAVREAAVAEGGINFTRDRDGVIRSVPLLLRAGGADVPSAALVAVARFARRRAVLDDAPATGTVYGAGRAIPLSDTDRMRINFLGPPSRTADPPSIPLVSFVDVVENRFDPARVRDRLVLLGAAIPGIDEHVTPTSSDVPMWGVEVLAHAVETILQQRFLVPIGRTAQASLAIAGALAGALAAGTLRPLPAGAVVLVLLVADVVLAAVTFERGTVVDMVDPALAITLAFGVALGWRVVHEQAEQRRIRDVAARYLSPSVSEWVLADPGRLALGGDTREMTVLFSDLRGFTTMSHRLPPRALVELLNEYMTAMTAVVFRHDGVLDKYIGDALMAFWNAPREQPDHARRACTAALDMLATLETLHARWRARGAPLFELGIGINTGPMIVGNMGSTDRLAYTVLGDAVNVSSRLESLSKLYGSRVVAGARTRETAGDAFVWRPLDRVAVKGRDEAVEIFELVGDASTADGTRAFVREWEEGIQLYRARRFSDAGRIFDALGARMPEDGPVRLYQARTSSLLAAPPGDDWDGIYRAETK